MSMTRASFWRACPMIAWLTCTLPATITKPMISSWTRTALPWPTRCGIYCATPTRFWGRCRPCWSAISTSRRCRSCWPKCQPLPVSNVSKKASAVKTPPERQRQLQAAFAAYLRDPDNNPAPEGVEERRLAIYRRLFFGNLRNLMAKNFPVLRRMLDDAEWDRLIRELMVTHRSTTPLFPEIGSEMLEFLNASGEQWFQARPWMAELAQWEYLETLARLHEGEVAESEQMDAEVLKRSIELNPTLQMARFAWP